MLNIRQVFFETFKGLVAEVVFDLAGIFPGGFFRNSTPHEQIRKEHMSFVGFLGDFFTGICEENVSVLISGNVAVFFQLFHGDTDARLGETQMVYNVDGAYTPFFISQNQYGFQIVFCGFKYFQFRASYLMAVSSASFIISVNEF